MAYHLSFAGSLADSVRTCAAEELDNATSLLGEEFDRDPVVAVHDARKSLKKTRALLRLVRPGLPNRVYRHENGTLRDAARLVSGARDADVLVETVGALARRYVGQLPAADFEALRDHLRAAARDGRAGGAAGEDRAQAVAMLDEVSGRIAAWPLDRADWATAAAGIERAYRAGRDAYGAIADEDDEGGGPTVEQLHDWRKRVKDLWYHQRLISAAWPEVLEAQAEAAHRLSEILGDDHDLAVLGERLGGGGSGESGESGGSGDSGGSANVGGSGGSGSDGDRDGERPPLPIDPGPMAALVAARRAELLAEARHLGSLIYAERPRAFAGRIRRVLEAGRAAAAAEAGGGGAVEAGDGLRV